MERVGNDLAEFNLLNMRDFLKGILSLCCLFDVIYIPSLESWETAIAVMSTEGSGLASDTISGSDFIVEIFYEPSQK